MVLSVDFWCYSSRLGEDAVASREQVTWGPGTAVQAEETRGRRPGG